MGGGARALIEEGAGGAGCRGGKEGWAARGTGTREAGLSKGVGGMEKLKGYTRIHRCRCWCRHICIPASALPARGRLRQEPHRREC